jgi:DMSO/TMAO reductase YedYZ molybdopterin-dependent catalytic subunit
MATPEVLRPPSASSSSHPSHPRRPRALLLGLGAGLVAGVIFNAASLGFRHLVGAPSLPEDVSDLTVPYIPASLFGRLLSDLGSQGKPLLIEGSIAGSTFGFVLAALAYAALLRRGVRPWRLTVIMGLAGFAGLWALFGPVLDANDAGGTLLLRRATGALTLLVDVALGMAVLHLVLGRTLAPAHGATGAGGAMEERRRFLRGLVTLGGGALVGATGLGAALRSFTGATNYDYEGHGVAAEHLLDPITPTEAHYVVSKNLVDPTVETGLWRLEVTGMVERPVTLAIDDLRRLPQQEEIVTLECIANGVGGSLMSTARWRGPRLAGVLALAGGVDPRATHLIVSAVDGYQDSLPASVAGDPGTLVALEMNGATLPHRHGYPARILVPGRYGEKNMKWLSGIEVADHDHQGFYQRQGWSETAVVRTFSRIDNLGAGSQLPAGRPVTVRGHAYAGTRGIRAVQVSTDSGATWSDADLDAQISPYAWRFFSWRWTPPAPGTHRMAVRAVDGSGAVQPDRYEDIVPRGASGYHRFDVVAR